MLKKFGLLMIVLFVGLMACEKNEELTVQINPGIDTVEINTPFYDQGATCKMGSETIPCEVYHNNVDTTKIGTYQIVYMATNGEESLVAVRMVTITDETAPVMTLLPGVDTVTIEDIWVDAGVEISDNSGEILTAETETVGLTDSIGQFYVYYSATDSSGNVTTIIRIVIVVESTIITS